jgi:hypothetical protein
MSSLTTTAPVMPSLASRIGTAEFWMVFRTPSNVSISMTSLAEVSPLTSARTEAHSSGASLVPAACHQPLLSAYRSCPDGSEPPQIRCEAGFRAGLVRPGIARRQCSQICRALDQSQVHLGRGLRHLAVDRKRAERTAILGEERRPDRSSMTRHSASSTAESGAPAAIISSTCSSPWSSVPTSRDSPI